MAQGREIWLQFSLNTCSTQICWRAAGRMETGLVGSFQMSKWQRKCPALFCRTCSKLRLRACFKMFKSGRHWTQWAHLHPGTFTMHKKKPAEIHMPWVFFLLLAQSFVSICVDRGGGKEQPACCLSRTLSSCLMLQEHHGWLPELTSCSQPQPCKASLDSTAWQCKKHSSVLNLVS